MATKKPDRPEAILMTLGLTEDGKGVILVALTQEEAETGRSEAHQEQLETMTWDDSRVGHYGAIARKHLRGQPGTIYRVRADPHDDVRPGIIYPSTATIMGLWPNEGHRASWSMINEALKRNLSLEKESKVKAWQEQLEPIRRVYRDSRGIHRNQVLAAVVQYITS